MLRTALKVYIPITILLGQITRTVTIRTFCYGEPQHVFSLQNSTFAGTLALEMENMSSYVS